MSPIGHIDPELHGLLDEIVTDPRSALRLTPRKALASWLFSDERVRPLPSATRAERHLLEAHREALAELLIQASRVAYWKAPSLGISVASPLASRIPSLTEEQLERRTMAESRHNPELDSNLGALLRNTPLQAESALDLAQASLALVPSDEARYAVAVALPESESVGAIQLLNGLIERQERKQNAELLWRLWSTRGSRLATAGKFDSARDAYCQCRGKSAFAIAVEFCIANLSFYLGDPVRAREAAQQIALDLSAAQFAGEQQRGFAVFAKSQDTRTLNQAKETFRKMSALPSALITACEVLR